MLLSVVRKLNVCELPLHIFLFYPCRENFKMDSILQRVESEHKKDVQEERYHTNYSLCTSFYDRWIVYSII